MGNVHICTRLGRAARGIMSRTGSSTHGIQKGEVHIRSEKGQVGMKCAPRDMESNQVPKGYYTSPQTDVRIPKVIRVHQEHRNGQID